MTDSTVQKMHLVCPHCNTEDEQSLAAKYNIRSIPTLAVFVRGREIARQPRAMSAPDLARWVSAALLKA